MYQIYCRYDYEYLATSFGAVCVSLFSNLLFTDANQILFLIVVVTRIE